MPEIDNDEISLYQYLKSCKQNNMLFVDVLHELTINDLSDTKALERIWVSIANK